MYFNAHFMLLGSLPIFAFRYTYSQPPYWSHFQVTLPLQGFVSWISVDLNLALVATLILVSGAIIPILGLKYWKIWNWIMFTLGSIGAVTFIGILAFSSHEQFVTGFNNYAAQYGTSYQGIIDLAKANGFVLTPFLLAPTLIAMQFTTLYITTAWPVYIGGEAEEGRRSLAVAIIGSIVFAWILTDTIAGSFL